MVRPASFEGELESLAARRLPLAIAILVAFLAGAFPVELYYFPSHEGAYLRLFAFEASLSALAFAGGLRWPNRSRTIATAWATAMAGCVVAYYPVVGGDPTLAMAALVCLVAAMPAMVPLDWHHQAILGGTAMSGLALLVLTDLPSSLPWPYLMIAMGAVTLVSCIGAGAGVRFRTAAWSREARLREARDELRLALARAEAAVELRSRLVANVSHEFRTPLHVIIGYADMLLDEATDPAAIRPLASRMRENALALDDLIAELLDLSRLSAGRVERRVAALDVPAMLAEVADGTRRLLAGRPVKVRVECTLRSFRSDPLRVRQILSNLAGNAAKFTARGEIRLVARPSPGGAMFVVKDTGCGIPEEKQATIFSAFEQVAPGGSARSGIGLGLAIVRQLCDLLGGRVHVASRPGRGSTFTVWLPDLEPGAVREPSPGEEMAREAAPAEAEQPARDEAPEAAAASR